ncbi:Ribosomal large subunit pseudouridine synthase C [Rubripirellula lacrimiformis]|uniref:Ribosomal large subunit pseudouridine synthase C n=1 Tax=Rubripirellula lacrimiformis TaxID=1930273 RepID=A0A517N827_9BACT|nr:RluA family pseudouridine synthase [Rubripirellula lacrimiformis]QDT03289.1 Ribosomal large subunit pseudouridine synthase C [Rubripirellula lacrimiformis]
MTELKIVWDGGHLIAVDKPAGLSTQAPPGCDSLEFRLRAQLAPRTQYLAIVHRLDRPVSGIVLVALRKKEARLISDQFATRKVTKQYAAIVAGHVVPGQSVWTDHVRKVPDRPLAQICDASVDGAKHAETRVQVIAYDQSVDRSLLHLFPHTGRMHQLRIQSSHRGHPIIGDSDYGSVDNESAPQPTVPGPLMLRAESIEFHDPANGRRISASVETLPWTDGFG